MSLKTYKPYTKSTLTTILVDRKGIWKGRPVKSLTAGKISTGGRNNLGRITSRAKGSGHKKRYRIIDFYRNKLDVKAKVERIEYDPNRSCHIMLVKFEDGKKFYYALGGIKAVGYEAVSNIVIERIKNGKFKSINDFLNRVNPKDINKLQLEWLV